MQFRMLRVRAMILLGRKREEKASPELVSTGKGSRDAVGM